MGQIAALDSLNNAPNTFFPSAITETEVTDVYLTDVLLAYPEIKKQMIRQVCEELSLPLTQRVLGFGRTVSETDLRNTDKMSIAASKIQWTVQPWLRQLLCLCSTPEGTGANDTDIHFSFTDDWATPGMVLMFQDGNGNFQNVMLNSYGTAAGSGCFTYTGRLVTSDPAVTFDAATFAQPGQCVGWSYDLVAQCADTSVKVPFRTPAWLENYTTTVMTDQDICTTGIQQMLWIEGVDGSRCFQPWQEFQMMQNYLKSFEMRGWYGTKTVNLSNGNVLLTDWEDNQVLAGSGVLEQIDSLGTVNSYAIGPSGYNNPTQYEAFLNFFQDTIITWAQQNGLTGGLEMDIWAGMQAYNFLQRVLTNFANQAGGCCYITDYESGNVYEYKVGVEFRQYYFAGFSFNLKKCAVFDDVSVQGFQRNGGPWESWRFVVMPDTTCDGTPLIQYYSRGGCGTSNAFIHKYIPGTIDPANPNSSTAVNHKKGYNVFFNSEGVWILNDPGKILDFRPTYAP